MTTVDLITPENLSKEFLMSLFESAFMETSLDDDGDLMVRERITCWVLPNMEQKDRVQLLSMFRLKPESTQLQSLECANRINAAYVIIKASVRPNNRLAFTWDIPISGGITPKAFILAVKRFCNIPHAALEEYGKDIVE